MNDRGSGRPAMMGKRFSTQPLYMQIRDALVERVLSGEWKPGATLPNEGELARAFGVSVGTVRKALDCMEAERLLSRRQGKGTFVQDQTSGELAGRFDNIRAANGEAVETDVGETAISEGVASTPECERLALPLSHPVYRIRRLHLRNRRPFLVEDATMPAELFPGLAAKERVSHRIAVLAQQYGLLLGRAEERISAGTAEAAVAAALGLAAGSPVLRMDRVTLTLDGRRAEWRVRCCHFADGGYYLVSMR